MKSWFKKSEDPELFSQQDRKLELDEANLLYRTMCQSRCIDETEAKLIARGETFFHVSGAGHEGTAVLNHFLLPEDYLHLHYRDKALMLARGIKPVQFFHSLLCNEESHSLGRQMSAHMSNRKLNILSIVAPVGNSALQAVGVAAALKRGGKKGLVLCSMGDGSSQQGEVLEAIAEAVRSNLPVLFLIQDNHYAISTRTKGQTFYSLPHGDATEFMGLPIHRMNGWDVVECYRKMGPVVQGIRDQGKPGLVLLNVERLASHTNADDQTRYRTEEEMRLAAEQRDPIRNLEAFLLKSGTSATDLESLKKSVQAEMEAAAARALKVWVAKAATDAKKPLPPHLANAAESVAPSNGEAKLTMLESIRGVLKQRLAADQRVILYGEDIEDPKGDVFGVTRGLSKEFPGRVLNSALSESTIVGTSIGRALAGERPVAMIQFADFLPLAFNQIFSELATMYWRTAGQWECPVIIMAPCGGFRPGLGPFHGQTMESGLAHAPGLDVFMPSDATDAAGLLNAAFESGRPTVFLYPKVCLNAREALAPERALQAIVPIGKAKFLSRGSDLTLVTWGAAVPICRKVTEALQTARVSVDLIDLRSISPWDREAVCESAERTGTLVVVHEDNLTAGFGAELIAAVNESVPKKIPSRRITRLDTYIPCRFANQLEVLPSFKRIMAEVCEVLGLELGWTAGETATGSSEVVKAIGAADGRSKMTIASWKVKPGDIVERGAMIADIEQTGQISALRAPKQGLVEEILVPAGNLIAIGTSILRLSVANSDKRISPTVILQSGEPVVRRKEVSETLHEREGVPRPRSGGFSVSAQEMADNTVFADITEDSEWMTRARWLTAEGYVALANPKVNIGLEDVYNVVTADVYDQRSRSRTFAALTTDPRSGATRISGTVRGVFGMPMATQELPPVDAMNFVEPLNGWPHTALGLGDEQIGEIGRFFLPSRCRTVEMRRAGISTWLTLQLLESVSKHMGQAKIKILYIIMPAYVFRLTPGVSYTEIPSRLRTEDPSAAAVFEQFSLYWERANPKLYAFFPHDSNINLLPVD